MAKDFFVFPVGYYLSLNRHDTPIQQDTRVLSLAEQRPNIPPTRQIPEQMRNWNEASAPVFTWQLLPFMNEYWDHFREKSLEKEILWRWENRRVSNEFMAERQNVRQQLLNAYILNLLIQRFFLNSLFRRQNFLDWQLNKQNMHEIKLDHHLKSVFEKAAIEKFLSKKQHVQLLPSFPEASFSKQSWNQSASLLEPKLEDRLTRINLERMSEFKKILTKKFFDTLEKIGSLLQQRHFAEARHYLSSLVEQAETSLRSFPEQWKRVTNDSFELLLAQIQDSSANYPQLLKQLSQAPLHNGQFEISLKNPLVFTPKRINSKQEQMEIAIQNKNSIDALTHHLVEAKEQIRVSESFALYSAHSQWMQKLAASDQNILAQPQRTSPVQASATKVKKISSI